MPYSVNSNISSVAFYSLGKLDWFLEGEDRHVVVEPVGPVGGGDGVTQYPPTGIEPSPKI
jgi:hypothetical protein